MSDYSDGDFLDSRNGGVMAAELRNALKVSLLYPPHHEEKGERSGSGGQKLREPRQLYSATSLLHPPKWPIECQVVPEKISHLCSVPPSTEPFYVTTNSEPQPRPVGEEMGTVIYDYQPKLCVDYYCRSSFGGSDELTAYDSDETTLKFESRFEAGNLAKVLKVTNVYYELYLRPDMYTSSHAQWYYFRIQNTRENIVYRFSIVNLSKPDSLYRSGMKPLLYSEKNAENSGIGWVRCGYNISYYKNDITTCDNTSSFTLTFNLKFQYSNDTVYIAQCYPYTYSNLQTYLQQIQSDKNKAQICQQRLLCKSLAGNNVYVLTITSPDDEEQERVKKPAIVLTARVHPGESPSSYMMKGVIDFLTSESSHAENLRNRFIFKLIPMLNPDGVIVGNSRCCLLGQDLNRQYRTVLREAFPQIYQKKILLRRLVDENGIYLYCDIHGHSRRNNVFMYGCENRRIAEKRLTEQVFPLMMHKNAADKFSFPSCKFRIQKCKEGTGRIFVWTLGVTNSYTLEISLCGSTLGSREHTHFNFVDYEDLGRHFCETLLDYSDTTVMKEKIRQKILDKLKTGGSTAEEPKNIPISDYSSLSHSDTDNESDTTEDDDEMDIIKTKKSVARQASLRNSRSILPVKPKSDESTKLRKLKIDRYPGRKQTVESKNSATIRTSRVPSTKAATEVQLDSITSTIKYTNLIFHDRDSFRNTRASGTSSPEETDAGTQTEDECDCKDAAQKNAIYLPGSNKLVSGFKAIKLLTTPGVHVRSRVRYTQTSSHNILDMHPEKQGTFVKLPCLQTKSLSTEPRRSSLPLDHLLKKQIEHKRKNQLHISHVESSVYRLSTNVDSSAMSFRQRSTKLSISTKMGNRRVSLGDEAFMSQGLSPRRHCWDTNTKTILGKSKSSFPGTLKQQFTSEVTFVNQEKTNDRQTKDGHKKRKSLKR